jgi:TctA family transporter
LAFFCVLGVYSIQEDLFMFRIIIILRILAFIMTDGKA